MDLLDRMVGHDRWATTLFLEKSRQLSDAQLDQQFDIGQGSLRETFDHMISVVDSWTRQMIGQPEPPPREERPSIGVQGVGRAWERLGSSDFNRPGTHGTARQRIDAIEEGYFFAENGEDLDGAAAAAWDHIRAYG